MRARTFETREAWEAARNSTPCIGGSDVACIIGRHPQKTQWELWARLHGHGADREDMPRLRMGRRLESIVLDEWADAHPLLTCERRPFDMFIHRDHEWAVATLDGIARDGEPVGVVEAKTVCAWQESAWGDPGEIVLATLADLAPERLPVPVHYALQVVWQMAVTGLGEGWLVALFGSDLAGVREWHIPRPDWLCDLLVEAAAEWWERHVLDAEPPPIDESDACGAYYRARMVDGERERVEDPTPNQEAARLAYEQAAAAKKEAERQQALAKNTLLASGVEPQNVRGQVRLIRRAAKEARAA